MKTYTVMITVLLCLCIKTSVAQVVFPSTSKDSIISNAWMLGFGYNIVDDSGDVFHELFSLNSQWNSVPYPSRISLGRYFKSGLGLEFIATYNKYKTGKIIDGIVNDSDKDYLGFDTRLSYDINKVIGETAWFDPYVGVGSGYTDANSKTRATYNAVIGFRTWFSERWGMDFSSSGKWSFGSVASNHIQHAAGVVYQFDIEKEISKKGIKRQTVWEQMEQEKQRETDSISSVRQAEEDARAFVDRLAREKEAAQLAAVEKAKIDTENSRGKKLQEAISSLGHVYFDLNSSYLNKESKAILDQLSKILFDNAKVELTITSFTDSRGTENYNSWLSERRAGRTMGYLIKKGIDPRRLETEGLGENQLTNHCDDGIHCTEDEHRANRRSQFGVSAF